MRDRLSGTALALVCPKLVVFQLSTKCVLLCRRTGEELYDGLWSFPGGKLDAGDPDIASGLRREITEELGRTFEYELVGRLSQMVTVPDPSGRMMLLPHYPASHVSGGVVLSAEYSAYAWCPLAEIDNRADTIPGVPAIAQSLYTTLVS